jgi:hypothetical protein
MNRKLKNTLGLVALLLFILIAGGIYIFVVQKGSITDKTKKVAELNAHSMEKTTLLQELDDMKLRAAVLDSILAARKFNIPKDISSIKFFTFVNGVSSSLSPEMRINVEYNGKKPERDFEFFEYKLTGGGSYNDLYKFLYSIEQAKELKKIKDLTLSNMVIEDKEGRPQFLVGFNMTVNTYTSKDDRFSTSEFNENNLSTRMYHDAFYPIIRNEIAPNLDMLLDVQGARLLALIPEGAFLSDVKGNTYLLWEGEQVYLGYLTKIDYDHNTVSFILNKGGIIEKVDLYLQPEIKKKSK